MFALQQFVGAQVRTAAAPSRKQAAHRGPSYAVEIKQGKHSTCFDAADDTDGKNAMIRLLATSRPSEGRRK
jgi:hypothetical protein